ncbi:MAG: TraI domain-containing protein [Alteromonadaceae bacterium]|nr:TraI domain-containing protein [Alteromonadaceae bacterium]
MKRAQSKPLASYTEQSVLRFKGIYFLVGFVTKLDRQSNPYVEIRISDATATQILYCRDQTCIDGDIQPNSLVHIEGRLEHAGKRPYFSCKYVGACTQGSMNFRHLLQLPSWLCRDSTSLNRLIALVESIHTNELQDFVCRVILQPDVAVKYVTCPASLTSHHTYAGGLLDHSIEVATNFAATKTRNTIQYDFAVVAGLLHSIGATRTLTSDLTLSDIGISKDQDSLTFKVCEAALSELFQKNRWAASQLCQMLTCNSSDSKPTSRPRTFLVRQLQEHHRDSVLNNKFNAIYSTN